MSVPLTLFYTNRASTTVSTANQVSVTHGVDNTNVTQAYSQLGTKTLFGEIYPQGNTIAWPASGFPFAADGHGFVLEYATLNLSGQELIAGNYSANVRLATGHIDGTLTGSVTGCSILVRVFKYIGGLYTTILIMSTSNKTINSTVTTFSLSGSTVVATPFAFGELLYTDILVSVGGNANNDVALQFQLSRLSTNFTGDTNAQIVTPGYQATPRPPIQHVRRQFNYHMGRVYDV